MSRTYRSFVIPIDCNCGAEVFVPWNETVQEVNKWNSKLGYVYSRECDCHGTKHDYWSKRNLKRDRKCWSKPDKKFKTEKKRLRRAKERAYMDSCRVSGYLDSYENYPVFKQDNVWDWN